jgi:hypothetical protein
MWQALATFFVKFFVALNTNQSIDVHTVNSKLLHDWDEVKVGGVLGRDSCNSPRPV